MTKIPPHDPAKLERALRAVEAAAQAHFGAEYTFEARVLNGQLDVGQLVKGSQHLRDAGLDALDDDELVFSLNLGDPVTAAMNDIQYGTVTGVITSRSGFTGVAMDVLRRELGLPNLVDAKADLVRRAMASGDSRLVRGAHGVLERRKRYTASREELRELLEREDVPEGTPFELREELIDLKQLLISLLEPPASADVREALRTFGLDLEQRTIDGRPWTQLNEHMEGVYSPWRVVEKVTREYGEISLEHARLLEPSAQLGSELRFPQLSAQAWPGMAKLFPDDDALRFIGTHEAAAFERLRPMVAPVETPAALRPFDLGPLRRLFSVDHGALYADVPGGRVLALWKELNAASTGFRPVLLGGDPRELREAKLAWDEPPLTGLQAGTHPSDSPSAVLAAAETVDVKALLSDGGNPSYPDARPRHGEWPEEPSPDTIAALMQPLDRGPWKTVRLALVPVDAAWKTLAHLPVLLQAGEATPSLAQACAVSREWEEKYGARVLSVRPALIEWWVETKPSRDAALELAPKHFAFTPEGGNGVLEARANELVSHVWSSWWD
jgi:hypothetical protein